MPRRIKMQTLLNKYRVFIWDFDGTLYDTYPETVRAYGETLAAARINVPPETLEEKARLSFGVLHEYLTREYGLDAEFYEKCHVRRRELEPLFSHPFPGAKEFCEEVIRRGGENWLYTHRDGSALALLRSSGMEDLFADRVLADDGFPWKPAPDALLALVARNGREKGECVMIGDREIDVLAGNNAGLDSCLLMPYDPSAPTAAKYLCTGFC